MLMLFLITGVELEMAHEIKHPLPLSVCYSWSTMLERTEVGANGKRGVVLNYGHDPSGTVGVLKAYVPVRYISSSFITAPRRTPHTCKAAF